MIHREKNDGKYKPSSSNILPIVRNRSHVYYASSVKFGSINKPPRLTPYSRTAVLFSDCLNVKLLIHFSPRHTTRVSRAICCKIACVGSSVVHPD